MQRRLLVMRHAKSSWKSGGETDHARPLNPRGRQDAPRIAQRLRELAWQPQVVISSDSQRTRETLNLMENAFEATLTVQFTAAFYLGGFAELGAELCQLSPQVTCVLALGHNPGWEDVVRRLTGEPVILKTATVALLGGEGATWEDALKKHQGWALRDVIRPREL